MASGTHPSTDDFLDFCKAVVGKAGLKYTTSQQREIVVGALFEAYEDSIVMQAGQNRLLINRTGIVALYEGIGRPSIFGGQP